MRPGPLCDLHRAIRAPWSGIRRIPRAFRRASLITRDSMFLRPPPLRPSSARPSLSFVPRTSLHWQNSREPRRSSLIFSHPEKSNWFHLHSLLRYARKHIPKTLSKMWLIRIFFFNNNTIVNFLTFSFLIINAIRILLLKPFFILSQNIRILNLFIKVI